MKKILFCLALSFITLPKVVFAQDDLMKMAMQNADSGKAKVITEYARTARKISGRTNELHNTDNWFGQRNCGKEISRKQHTCSARVY